MLLILFFYLAIFFSIIVNPVMAFDNDEVHPKINQNAVIQSNLDIYLQEYLGFEQGIDTMVLKKNVSVHIEQGGTDEDVPSTRVLNHFHDPLKPWEESMLAAPPRNGGSSHHA